jgi:hypothetical protein
MTARSAATGGETSELLEAVRDFLATYVVLQDGSHFDAISLWVMHAHAVEAAETSPRLVLLSAEKSSGKTRVLECLELLTPHALSTINCTVAALFRVLADEPVTILLDEADAIFGPRAAKEHEDLRALLNAGYRRGATVIRVVGEGRKMKVVRFPVFAATAVASIGRLPDTIESRALIIPMRRRAPDEPVQPFRRRHAKPVGDALRERLSIWASQSVGVLVDAEPRMPTVITDRAADCWEPLLAIGDLAGGDWPSRARIAAEAIVSGRIADDQSVGVQLLDDIRAVIGGHDRIPSALLAHALNSLEVSSWGAMRGGQGIDQRGLAKFLKPYGIEPKVIKLPDSSTPRGYLREQFVDAWTRYLRPGGATGATNATPIRIQVAEVAKVAEGDGAEEGLADFDRFVVGR